MFYDCENLSELNLSSFNTNNVIYTDEMFTSCNKLNQIIINKLNVNNFKEQINISKLKF